MGKVVNRFADVIVEVDERDCSIYFSDEFVNKPAVVFFFNKIVYRGRLPYAIFIELEKPYTPEIIQNFLEIERVFLSELLGQ